LTEITKEVQPVSVTNQCLLTTYPYKFNHSVTLLTNNPFFLPRRYSILSLRENFRYGDKLSS